MKDAYYFSHDANARNDIKIRALKKEYDIAGYGAYWVLVEMLREQEDYKLPLKEFTYIAFEDETGLEDGEGFIRNCIDKYELFVSDGNYFWSNSLNRRMNKANDIKIKRKKAANARWNNDNAKQKQSISNAKLCKSNANAIQNDTKEIKGKEIKRNSNSTTTPPIIPPKDEQIAGSNIFFEDGYEEISKMYQQVIGVPNGFTHDWINGILQDYGYEWCKQALIIAEKHEKRSKAYVEGVLSNWKTNGGMKLKKPKNKASPKKPPQGSNFEQRQYSDEFLENVYANT